MGRWRDLTGIDSFPARNSKQVRCFIPKLGMFIRRETNELRLDCLTHKAGHMNETAISGWGLTSNSVWVGSLAIFDGFDIVGTPDTPI